MHDYYRRPTLSDESLAAIHGVLQRVAGQVSARLALLADPTGQELSFCGTLKAGEAETLSALSAGQLGASQALIDALRISPTFTWMIREGPDYNCFLSAPAGCYVLLLVVSTDMPLGWVRQLLRDCHDELAPLLAQAEREHAEALEADSSPDGAPDFVGNLLESLDSFWEEGG